MFGFPTEQQGGRDDKSPAHNQKTVKMRAVPTLAIRRD